MKKLYVGIDVGALSFTASVAETKGERLGRAKEFVNRPVGFKRLMAWAESFRKDAVDVHACYEATGVYGLRLTNYLLDKTDWKVSVVNPLSIKEFRKTVLAKTKTDKQDSFYHAQYPIYFDPPAFRRPEPIYKELEQIIAARQALVRIVRTEKLQLYTYRLRPIRNKLTMEIKRKRIAGVEADAASLLDEAVRVALKNPQSKADIDLLSTIPGVGVQTAVSLLPVLVRMNPNLTNCRKLISYAGLDVAERQSGTSVRGIPHLSKKGNVHFREPLYMSALTASRRNPVIKTLYERLQAAGQTKRKAVVTCMPRLLRLIWGVWRHQQPFDAKVWRGNVDTENKAHAEESLKN